MLAIWSLKGCLCRFSTAIKLNLIKEKKKEKERKRKDIKHLAHVEKHEQNSYTWRDINPRPLIIDVFRPARQMFMLFMCGLKMYIMLSQICFVAVFAVLEVSI